MDVTYFFPRTFSWGLAFPQPPHGADSPPEPLLDAVDLVGWPMPWPATEAQRTRHRQAFDWARSRGKQVWIWLVPHTAQDAEGTLAGARSAACPEAQRCFLKLTNPTAPGLPGGFDGGLLALPSVERLPWWARRRLWRGLDRLFRRHPKALWGLQPQVHFPQHPAQPVNTGGLVDLFQHLSRRWGGRFWLLDPLGQHRATVSGLVVLLLQLWHVHNMNDLGVTAFFLEWGKHPAAVYALYQEVATDNALAHAHVARHAAEALPWLYQGLPYDAPEFKAAATPLARR